MSLGLIELTNKICRGRDPHLGLYHLSSLRVTPGFMKAGLKSCHASLKVKSNILKMNSVIFQITNRTNGKT